MSRISGTCHLLLPLGSLTCEVSDGTSSNTGIELYDFRYADMQKLAKFMATKPDWKFKSGQYTYDVSEPNIEDKELINLLNSQTQPAGLFSFLIFHDPKTNKIFLGDNEILENNAVDSRLTLGRLSSHIDKQPKIYFKYGYEGCKQITNFSSVNYGQSN